MFTSFAKSNSLECFPANSRYLVESTGQTLQYGENSMEHAGSATQRFDIKLVSFNALKEFHLLSMISCKLRLVINYRMNFRKFRWRSAQF